MSLKWGCMSIRCHSMIPVANDNQWCVRLQIKIMFLTLLISPHGVLIYCNTCGPNKRSTSWLRVSACILLSTNNSLQKPDPGGPGHGRKPKRPILTVLGNRAYCCRSSVIIQLLDTEGRRHWCSARLFSILEVLSAQSFHTGAPILKMWHSLCRQSLLPIQSTFNVMSLIKKNNLKYWLRNIS